MMNFDAFWLNIFSRKEDISTHFGPGVLIDGTEADYNIHCRIPFGNYYQTYEKNTHTNTNTIRTISDISLSHNGNS